MAEQTDVPATGDNTIPRLKLGEIGNPGLVVIGGNVFEECQHELRWPFAVHTFSEMAKDASIKAALSLVELMIARVEWDAVVPEDASEDMKKKQTFLRQCMKDMDNSWFSFMREVVSFNRYGFDVHEKVFRRRRKQFGSRYNDGLVGIKKLAVRSQDSIKEWKWDELGRELEGLIQTVRRPQQKNTTGFAYEDVTIPRSKFLLFRTDSQKDSPTGQSPLIGCWAAWKYKKSLEEHEGIGVSQDMRGLKVLYIPPQYMQEDASDSDKEVYEYYKRIMRNLHNNEQSGLILPQVLDPDAREQYFKFEVVSVTGQKGYNVNEIIQRYTNEIMTCLFADILKMGQDKMGSFALSDNKSNIMSMAIEAKLMEIRDVLNHDLIPHLFALNGWDTTETPLFQYGDLDEPDIDVFSKAIQRCAATAMIVKSPKNINHIAKTLGLPDRVKEDISQEELDKLLGADTSRSGDGLATGSGNGTSKSPSEDDNSTSNSEASAFEIVEETGDWVTVKILGKTTKFSREDYEELELEFNNGA